MSSFSPEVLTKKLHELNNSAPSIQTLSLWLIHHRKHAKNIVKIWKKELIRASSSSRKLTLMYLANDVVQNSKKKGAEFNQAFCTVLADVYQHLGSQSLDHKCQTGVQRLLHVWAERSVFSLQQLANFKCALESSDKSRTVTMSPDGLFKEPPPPAQSQNKNDRSVATSGGRKRKHKNTENAVNNGVVETDSGADVQQNGVSRVEAVSDSAPSSSYSPTKKPKTSEAKEVKEVRVTLSPHSPPQDPPEPSELIQALEDLEKSASSDVDTRQKIASLPAEVSDVSLLRNLCDRSSGVRLLEQVCSALDMLTSYNSRLAGEMDDRRRVARMLQDFTQSQKDLLVQAERTLEDYRVKLEKVYLVREELKSHIQNLPDISQLPNATGAPPALPSAGDLFS